MENKDERTEPQLINDNAPLEQELMDFTEDLPMESSYHAEVLAQELVEQAVSEGIRGAQMNQEHLDEVQQRILIDPFLPENELANGMNSQVIHLLEESQDEILRGLPPLQLEVLGPNEEPPPLHFWAERPIEEDEFNPSTVCLNPAPIARCSSLDLEGCLPPSPDDPFRTTDTSIDPKSLSGKKIGSSMADNPTQPPQFESPGPLSLPTQSEGESADVLNTPTEQEGTLTNLLQENQSAPDSTPSATPPWRCHRRIPSRSLKDLSFITSEEKKEKLTAFNETLLPNLEAVPDASPETIERDAELLISPSSPIEEFHTPDSLPDDVKEFLGLSEPPSPPTPDEIIELLPTRERLSSFNPLAPNLVLIDEKGKGSDHDSDSGVASNCPEIDNTYNWLFNTNHFVPNSSLTNPQVYMALGDEEEGAAGGSSRADWVEPDVSQTFVPTVKPTRIPEMDVEQWKERAFNSTSSDRRGRLDEILKLIPKTLLGIKSTVSQAARQFTAALVGSDFIAPDPRASHEMFRRGLITHVETTNDKVVLTVQHDCPTLQPDCVKGKCPHCHNKPYELVEYEIPSSKALNKRWYLVVGHLHETKDALQKLDRLFKELLSFPTDNREEVDESLQDTIQPEDSVSMISDVTHFAEDPDDKSDIPPLVWLTDLNWHPSWINIPGGKQIQIKVLGHQDRTNKMNATTWRLENREFLPHKGKASLAVHRQQFTRYSCNEEKYRNDIVNLSGQLMASNQSESAKGIATIIKDRVDLFLDEAADLARDLIERCEIANNFWRSRRDESGRWIDYRFVPEAVPTISSTPHVQPSPNVQRLIESTTAQQPSPPTIRRVALENQTVSMIRTEPSEKSRREVRERNPSPSLSRRLVAPSIPPSPPPSDPDSSDDDADTQVSKQSTVREIIRRSPHPDSTHHLTQPFSVPIVYNFSPSLRSSTDGDENQDYTNAVGSNAKLDEYEEQVCQQLHVNLQKDSQQIRKCGTKLVETIRALVTSLRSGHRLPTFSAIASMSESKLRTHMENGAVERSKLCDEVRKDHKLYESAFTNLVSSLLSARTTTWSEAKIFVTSLLTGSNGRTLNDYKKKFEEFMLRHKDISEQVADDKNVVKHGRPGASSSQIVPPSFSGDEKTSNLYVWLIGFKKIAKVQHWQSTEMVHHGQRALRDPALSTVKNQLKDIDTWDSFEKIMIKEFGKSSVIMSQIKGKHMHIGSLQLVDLTGSDYQLKQAILKKLDSHIGLYIDVKHVCEHAAGPELKNLSPNSPERKREKIRERYMEKTLQDDYLAVCVYLVPELPEFKRPDSAVSKVERFSWCYNVTSAWKTKILRELQERPKELKKAVYHPTLLATNESTCLAAAPTVSQAPQNPSQVPHNPPQFLKEGVPTGEVTTNLQAKKTRGGAGGRGARGAGRGANRGRGGRGGGQAPTTRTDDWQNQPCPRCFQATGANEFHSRYSCPTFKEERDKFLAPRLQSKKCTVCKELDSNSPGQPHVCKGKGVVRQFCPSITNFKVSEVRSLADDKTWCRTCMTTENLHNETNGYDPQTRTCNKKTYGTCRGCTKLAKLCTEHYSQNKDVLEDAEKLANSLGLEHNISLVISLSNEIPNEEPCDNVALFASPSVKPKMEFLKDQELRDRLTHKTNILQGIRAELPDKKQLFVMFDSGSTETMVISKVAGVHLPARTDLSIGTTYMKGFGGTKEVRTVEMDIPVLHYGKVSMVCQETEKIMDLAPANHTNLLELVKREYTARLEAGLLTQHDTRKKLDHVTVNAYGGSIGILFGIGAEAVSPQRIFTSCQGPFIFFTALDTGCCSQYGIAGLQPDLEAYAVFVDRLERRESDVTEFVKNFINDQQSLTQLVGGVNLSLNKSDEEALYINTCLPELPGWVTDKLVEEMKKESEEDAELETIDREFARRYMKGASNVISKLEKNKAAFFMYFCGDDLSNQPRTHWKLLIEGERLGDTLLMEAADWIWVRANDGRRGEVGSVSLGQVEYEGDNLSFSKGYCFGMTLDTSPRLPASWTEVKDVKNWLNELDKVGRRENSSELDRCTHAMAMLDSHVAPTSDYLNWVANLGFNVPPSWITDDSWKGLLCLYPLFMEHLHGEEGDLSAGFSKLGDEGGGCFSSHTAWIPSNQHVGEFYLGLRPDGKDSTTWINKMLEPEDGEMKTKLTYAKLLGPDLGKTTEAVGVVGRETGQDSMFLALPMQRLWGEDAIFLWLQTVILLLRCTKLSVIKCQRMILQCLHPRLIASLRTMTDVSQPNDNLILFAESLFRALTTISPVEPCKPRPWQSPYTPKWKTLEVTHGGCATFSNFILDPSQWDRFDTSGLTPFSFPVLNSIHRETVTSWTSSCRFLIQEYGLPSHYGNLVISNSVSLPIKPVLQDVIGGFNEGRGPNQTFLAISNRLENTHSPYYCSLSWPYPEKILESARNLCSSQHTVFSYNVKEFFRTKLSAVRRIVESGKLPIQIKFTCVQTDPFKPRRECLDHWCIGCSICHKDFTKFMKYEEERQEYVWTEAALSSIGTISCPHDRVGCTSNCFSCLGLNVSPTGSRCYCRGCLFIKMVLGFSFHKYVHSEEATVYDETIARLFFPSLPRLLRSTPKEKACSQPDRVAREDVKTPFSPFLASSSPAEQIITVNSEDETEILTKKKKGPKLTSYHPHKKQVSFSRTSSRETNSVDGAQANLPPRTREDRLPEPEPEKEKRDINEVSEDEKHHYVLEREDRLPVNQRPTDFDPYKLNFWYKRFKEEDDFQTVDTRRLDAYQILVDCRTTAWEEKGCKTCLSAKTEEDFSSRKNCPRQCYAKAGAKELANRGAMGFPFSPGVPHPSLEDSNHIFTARSNPPEASGPENQGCHLATPSTTSDLSIKLTLQYGHKPRTVGSETCCSTETQPMISFESKREKSNFLKRLDCLAISHLMQTPNGVLIPKSAAKDGIKNKHKKGKPIQLRAKNDIDIDTIIQGLLKAYNNSLHEIRILRMKYQKYEVNTWCSKRCEGGCMTSENDCFCEGCTICVNYEVSSPSRPLLGFSFCKLTFAEKLKAELSSNCHSPTGTITRALVFDTGLAKSNAEYLMTASQDLNLGRHLTIRQTDYRKKMYALRAFCSEFPGRGISSSCEQPCQEKGICLGASEGCFCEGCKYCTEFYGTGVNYLKTSEFVYTLKGNKKTLEKVCLALIIDLDKEAETARQNPSSKNSTKQTTARASLYNPGRRPFHFLPMMMTMMSLFCITTAVPLPSSSDCSPSWPYCYPPPLPSILAPSEFVRFVPGTARSSTSHYNLQSDFANLVFSPDVSNQPHSWPASSAIAFLNSTNGFLWSASSAVMLSAGGMVDRLWKLFKEPCKHVPSSKPYNNSNEKVDRHIPLMRNLPGHKKCFWNAPADQKLCRQIDKERSLPDKTFLGIAPEQGLESMDCLHCLIGCPGPEEKELVHYGDKIGLVSTTTEYELMEKLQDETLGSFSRCETCRACKVCSHLGEKVTGDLKKQHEQEFIRSCISFEPHPTDPNKERIHMKYPKREGWQSKLVNNKHHAVKNLQSIASSLLKEPAEIQEMVTKQMQQLKDKKFIVPVEEIPNWDKLLADCPIKGGYFTSHTLAFKPNSTNTDVRVCANFSKDCNTGKCFNNILCPGLTQYDFKHFSIAHRAKPAVTVADVSKFFNSVDLVPEELPLCQVLWFKDGVISNDPTNFQLCVMTTGWYGANSQPALMEAAKELSREKEPEKLIGVKFFEYVDDLQVVGEFPEKSEAGMISLSSVYRKRDLNIKGMATSGKDPDEALLSKSGYVDTAGVHWKSKEDLMQALINPVYIGKKIKGRIKDNADIFSGNTREEFLKWGMARNWNIKNVSEQLARLWDYAHGLLSPVRGMISCVLRTSHNLAHLEAVQKQTPRDAKTLWDYSLPGNLKEQLLKALWVGQDCAKHWYPRCSVSGDELEDPENPSFDLITFTDAGRDCMQTVHYAVHRLKNGKFRASYLWSQSKLRPVKARKDNGIQEVQSMPKSELAAMAMGAMSAREIYLLLRDLGCKRCYLSSDASCAIRWVTSANCELDAFMITRAKIIRDYYPLENILYVETKDQPADTGTKGIIEAKEVGPDSQFFKGPNFLTKGIDANIGKNLLTVHQLEERFMQGMANKSKVLKSGKNTEQEIREATKERRHQEKEINSWNNQMSNLLASEASYFTKGCDFDRTKPTVSLHISFKLHKSHLLSIITAVPRMNIIAEKESSILHLHSVTTPKIHIKRGSTHGCLFDGSCLLTGRYHSHSPITPAASRLADQLLPLPKRINPESPPPVKTPSIISQDKFLHLVSSPVVVPKKEFDGYVKGERDHSKFLEDRPFVVDLRGLSEKELIDWANRPNNIYIGKNPQVNLKFLEEYWVNNFTKIKDFESSFTSSIKSLRTVPFLTKKRLGCNCSEIENCHGHSLTKIYMKFFKEGFNATFLTTPSLGYEHTSSKISPMIDQETHEKCNLATVQGTLKRYVMNDELIINITRRRLDKSLTTVSLALLSARRWCKLCVKHAKSRTSKNRWTKRFESLTGNWNTKNRMLIDLFHTNPLNVVMGRSPEEEGRHIKHSEDKTDKKLTSIDGVDKYLREAKWYNYPGFHLVFKFCRTINRDSEFDMEKMMFQFTSIVILLTSLLGNGGAKVRPGLYTACIAIFCWVKQQFGELEANTKAALLDFSNLHRFFDLIPQQNRLQSLHHKRYIQRKWETNFGVSLDLNNLGLLYHYSTKNQKVILFETPEESDAVLRGSALYVVKKTQDSHGALSTRQSSKQFGQLNEDGVRLAARRLRQAVDLAEVLDFKDKSDLEKLGLLRINPNVPLIPTSPLTYAVISFIHHHFGQSPIHLHAKVKHHSTALDVAFTKCLIDGPNIYTIAQEEKHNCFACLCRSKEKLKALSGGIEETLKPNCMPNDIVFADLAGPYKVDSTTRHILVWVCAQTGYVSAWVLRDRTKKSMGCACKVMADLKNGFPKIIRTDQEGGLTAMLDGCLFEDIVPSTRRRIVQAPTVITCAAHNHEAHGTVERRVRDFKEDLGTLNWEHYTELDLVEAIQGVVKIINSRPISARVQGEVNPSIELICPEDMMFPNRTNTVATPIVHHQNFDQMQRDLERNSEVTMQAWQMFIPFNRLRHRAFQEQGKTPEEGDVVVMMDPTSMKPKHQRGMITRLIPSHDGIVRKVAVRIAGRSKMYANVINQPISIRSVRDLVVIPRVERTNLGKLTLDLEEKQSAVIPRDLAPVDELTEHEQEEVETEPLVYPGEDGPIDDPTEEVETEPLAYPDENDERNEEDEPQQYHVHPCKVDVKKLKLTEQQSSSLPNASVSRRSERIKSIKQPPTSHSQPTRSLRSNSRILTLSLLSSLVFPCETRPLNTTEQNTTLTVLPQTIKTVGYDTNSEYTNSTSKNEYLSLLNTHTCEPDEARYDKARTMNLQAVYTQSTIDVKFYQCKVLVSLYASWCGSNIDLQSDSRMHASISVIPPTILKLTADQCRKVVEKGIVDANLYESDGYKEVGKLVFERNVSRGFSSRSTTVHGLVGEDHSCSTQSKLHGSFYVKGEEFKQHILFRRSQFLIRIHKGVYVSGTDRFYVPNLVSFNSSSHEFFDNHHGTFMLAHANFSKPTTCSRTTELFSGQAHYYRHRLAGREAGGDQKGDIVTMRDAENRTAAFATTGMTTFCGADQVYRTNLKNVHLIKYEDSPKFPSVPTPDSGVDPLLNLRSQIISSTHNTELDIAKIAFDLRKRTCEISTITNLIKIGMISSMPEDKLLDNYLGFTARRVGGAAVLRRGVPLTVHLHHRASGKGICCNELSVAINDTNGTLHHTFLLPISRTISPHCTPTLCSNSSPVFHAIPSPSIQGRLLKEERLTWEDIFELEKGYDNENKSFWICDDSKEYYACPQSPSLLTASPALSEQPSTEIWLPEPTLDSSGALWTDKKIQDHQDHEWVTTAMSATAKVLGLSMNGRTLQLDEMHKQILEIEPEAKTSIINGFFPSFLGIAEYIPQALTLLLALLTFMMASTLFCCLYSTIQNIRVLIARYINAISSKITGNKYIDEENVRLTPADLKNSLKEQVKSQTKIEYQVKQMKKKLDVLFDNHIEKTKSISHPAIDGRYLANKLHHEISAQAQEDIDKLNSLRLQLNTSRLSPKSPPETFRSEDWAEFSPSDKVRVRFDASPVQQLPNPTI